MSKSRFRLFNITMGDHIAVVEMTEDVFKGLLDCKTLDPDRMTLRGIKNGGQFTLLPIEDHTVSILERVRDVYKTVTEKPAKLFSTTLNRMDDLIQVVGLMFGEVEYISVENGDDLDKIINPPRGGDYEPKKVKYTVLGDLLAKAKTDAGIEEEYVHGPNCSHN